MHKLGHSLQIEKIDVKSLLVRDVLARRKAVVCDSFLGQQEDRLAATCSKFEEVSASFDDMLERSGVDPAVLVA